MLLLKKKYFFTVYDEPNDPPPNDPPNDPPTKKTYSQEDVDNLVKQERTRLTANNQKTINELKTLRESANLTNEEKARLSTRVEELEQNILTKEEISKREKTKLENTHKEQLTSVTKDRDTWKTRFESNYLKHSLHSAAASAEAHNPEHFIDMLSSKAKITQKVDSDGKPVDAFEIKIPYSSKDKDGQVKELLLPPEEVIKLMKEDVDTYGYLFKGTKVPGAGMSGSGKGASGLNKDMTMDEYMKIRSTIIN